jgi:hypothetical protein
MPSRFPSPATTSTLSRNSLLLPIQETRPRSPSAKDPPAKLIPAQVNAGVIDGANKPLDRGIGRNRLRERPPELDCAEAGRCGGRRSLQQRPIGEQDRTIDSKTQSRPFGISRVRCGQPVMVVGICHDAAAVRVLATGGTAQSATVRRPMKYACCIGSLPALTRLVWVNSAPSPNPSNHVIPVGRAARGRTPGAHDGRV